MNYLYQNRIYMKKMTPTQLKQYVIAEAKKLARAEVLKEEKVKILGQLKMLNENERFDATQHQEKMNFQKDNQVQTPEKRKEYATIKFTADELSELEEALASSNFINNISGRPTFQKRLVVLQDVTNKIKNALNSTYPKRDEFGMDEQWNPDDNYAGDYFIATRPMDEPGEVDAHVIGDNQYDEYLEAGWDIGGPYDKQTAELKYEKLMSSNKQWRYYSSNQHDERSDFDLGNLHDFDRGDF